jgi:hypothetical protein
LLLALCFRPVLSAGWLFAYLTAIRYSESGFDICGAHFVVSAHRAIICSGRAKLLTLWRRVRVRQIAQGAGDVSERNVRVEVHGQIDRGVASELLRGLGVDARRGQVNRLASEVEELFFIYVVTREATRDFERNFTKWASELRKVNTAESFETFIDKTFRPAKANLSARFDDAFRRLDGYSVQLYRLRYILAKLTQYVDLSAYGETEGTRWLSRYMSNGFEIEHIYPQRPSAEAKEEFGECANFLIAGQLGNLVLVEKSINASLGNRAFSVKRSVYGESQVLLTRAVAVRPKIGANTKIDSTLASIEPFDTWNEVNVGRRQDMLRRLAHIVWNVPTPAPK